MSRPLRIEFAGATYHITSRGDRREDIFADDADAEQFLTIVAQGLERFDGRMLAYCLMSNHYHLVVATEAPTLSVLMRHINGVYTQDFNRRHRLVGHLFQGRFKAILVDTDRYLLELCRCVELNPVRAGMVATPADWPWSSYRAHAGLDDAPPWLEVADVQEVLLGRAAESAADFSRAAAAYVELVGVAGDGPSLWEEGLRQQVYLGDESFVARMQARADAQRAAAREVPRAQRSQVLELDEWLARCSCREEALWMAYTQSGQSMTALAQALGISVARVSQLIKRWASVKAPRKLD